MARKNKGGSFLHTCAYLSAYQFVTLNSQNEWLLGDNNDS